MKRDAWTLLLDCPPEQCPPGRGTLFADGERLGDAHRPLREIAAWLSESGFTWGEVYQGRVWKVKYEVEIIG